MATPSFHELSSRLDRAFASSNKIDDDEIKSHYARYLCVLTSGYLEECMKIIIRNYVACRSPRTILNHINSSTNNLTNLKTEKIGNYLYSFNSDWKDKFENALTDEEKDSIDSVVANRHLIAHGQNVGVSYVRVKEWYKNVKCVVEKVSRIVNS
jgi:hypothetical protein